MSARHGTGAPQVSQCQESHREFQHEILRFGSEAKPFTRTTRGGNLKKDPSGCLLRSYLTENLKILYFWLILYRSNFFVSQSYELIFPGFFLSLSNSLISGVFCV